MTDVRRRERIPISLQRILYLVLMGLLFVAALFILVYGMTGMEWQDFHVFYNAANSLLRGEPLYRITGEHNLPFWYFPWSAWIFVPFTFWPEDFSLVLYKLVFVIAAIVIVNNLFAFYNRDIRLADKVLALSMIVSVSLQTMIVGQNEYILLGLVVIVMYAIDRKRFTLAGALLPFAWTKPHLVIVFTLAALWLGGWRIVKAATLSTSALILIETVRSPGWYMEMFNLLKNGQSRTGQGPIFTTLPSLLGFQENWVGTGNLPITMLVIVVATFAIWKFRSLEPVPLLSLSLAASLVCAPRAYAYDLPMLIPAMIWLTAKDFQRTFWIWIVAGVLPPLVRYSEQSYLLTLLIFFLCMRKASLEARIAVAELNSRKHPGGHLTEH